MNHKQFEADIASLNMGKTVTMYASCMESHAAVLYLSAVITMTEHKNFAHETFNTAYSTAHKVLPMLIMWCGNGDCYQNNMPQLVA